MSQEAATLYYGQGCPHCAVVEDYLARHGSGNSINLEQKEVFHNQQNLQELRDKAHAAGIPDDYIGVPSLCEGDQCLVGENEIIDFFKQQAN